MEYIQRAEKKLRHYKDLVKSVNIMDREIIRLVGEAGPKTISAMVYDVTGVRGGHYDETINIITEIQFLQEKKEKTIKQLMEIDAIIEGINEDPGNDYYAVVLRRWYIESVPKEKIMREIGYNSLKSVYEIKNRAIRVLAIRLFGVDVL
jgi:hypothetical protein